MSGIGVCTLYSGSGGNCTYVRCGDTELLFDAGKSAKTLVKTLEAAGGRIDRIAAIFVTHEHGDHIGALEVISKNHHIPVHMTERSAARCLAGKTALASVARTHPPVFRERMGEVTVSSFVTPHDSALCVGYRVDFAGDSLGIATDIGYVAPELLDALCGCRTVLIEANHDPDMVISGSYPPELKYRILSGGGHLSNAECAKAAVRLASSGTENIILTHLSSENNRPDIARNTVLEALAKSGLSVGVTVAAPDKITYPEGCLCLK